MAVDAVVIGSGPNGLVAANMLADAGWSVLVLEAAQEPGGSVRTAELTAPGFRNDLCSSFYPMGAASPVLAALELERYGLRWVHAPEVLAHVLPDDRTVLLSRDVGRTAKSLETFASGDGDAWRSLFEDWLKIRKSLLDAITGPFPPVRASAGLLRALGVGDAVRLARTFTLTARRMGEEWFAGEGARVLLAGNGLHTDLGPDQAGSAAFGWLMAMLGQDVGFPVPAGGADGLTSALIARLRERGGQVLCGRRVTSVLIAGGRAVGVREESGVVQARRAVLADVPAPALYMDLVGEDHLPSALVSDISRFDWEEPVIKVDWALSSPIPWTVADAASAGTVHIGPDVNGLATFANELACGRLPRAPFLLLGQMTTTDPSRSPEGTESAWAYTHVPRGQWTPDRIRRRADRMEQAIEQHAPGFRDKIIARSVMGPTELAEHNLSLVEGSTNSGTAAIHQQLVFRPSPGTGRPDTPIDRLYLASASAHPGGAVHGAPGANAAKAAMARDGWAGSSYRLAIKAVQRALYR